MTKTEKDNLIEILSSPRFDTRLKALDYVKKCEVEDKEGKQRSLSQNNFIHAWFDDCAKYCLENGIDVRVALTMFEHLDLPMDGKLFKKMFVHPIIKWRAGKDSTAKLTNTEIDLIPDPIIKRFADKGYELPPFIPRKTEPTFFENQELRRKLGL